MSDRPPPDGPDERFPDDERIPTGPFEPATPRPSATGRADRGQGRAGSDDAWAAQEAWDEEASWDDGQGGDAGADWDDAEGWDDGFDREEGWATDQYVAVRPDRPGGRRWLVVLLALLVGIFVALGAAGLWVRNQIDPGNPGDEVALTIPSGATTGDIARLLEERDIITNPTIFEWYLRFRGGAPDGGFKAGDYAGLRERSAMGEVIDVLEQGPAPPQVATITIREGLWLSETKTAILDAFPEMDPTALDAAIANVQLPILPSWANSPEGVLFPATYEVPRAESNDPQILIDRMADAFGRVSATQGLPNAAVLLDDEVATRDISPYQALIVASMVEAEARTDADRPRIARVIYNRLDETMPLGIDATVLYALGDRFAELTQSRLQIDSPYNTRQVLGLPPGPINSPGEASIEAALNPAEGDWLYYVLADDEGNHEFTETYAEHQQAVERAREKGLL